MNGTKTPENTPFYTIDTEKHPQSIKKVPNGGKWHIPFVNNIYHIFNPRDLEEYSP